MMPDRIDFPAHAAMPCRIDLIKPGQCQECETTLGVPAMLAKHGGIGPAHHHTGAGSFCATHCPVHRNTETQYQKSLRSRDS